MTRAAIYFGFVLVAMAAAGAFGALHDQISYTAAPEYFTRFKFIQFRLLDQRVPERVRAAQVGFLASWWMGLPLGLLIGLGGFLQPTPARMLQALLVSIPVSFAFTLAFALAGLAYGYGQTAHIDRAAYAGWFIPIGVTDLRRFLCVGYMHNAAYLGGALAIPAAWSFLIYLWARHSVPPA